MAFHKFPKDKEKNNVYGFYYLFTPLSYDKYACNNVIM